MATTTQPRVSRSPEERDAMRREALDRAQNGQTLTNYPAIIIGFMDKGIPEAEILPRVNVFTYNAWLAKGRQVRKGEHGVKVVTMRPQVERDRDTGEERTILIPGSATVFHVSQTDEARP